MTGLPTGSKLHSRLPAKDIPAKHIELNYAQNCPYKKDTIPSDQRMYLHLCYTSPVGGWTFCGYLVHYKRVFFIPCVLLRFEAPGFFPL